VQIISELLASPGLKVLPAPVQAVRGLLELLKRSEVTGGDVFDLQIVATMQANNIRRIYTFNAADFQRFAELAVIIP
jgi:predicted nucleic acid-binding protein